jgi:probable FeS assembly SUF system protein SufT
MYPSPEKITLTRDVIGTLIPQGTKVELPEEAEAVITQALGGSFTVQVQGHLFRIEGKDADALGKTVKAGPQLPENPTDEDLEKAMWEQLRTCFDPEIPVNIVELGLIYECKIEPREDGSRRAKVRMTLTAPGCGMGEILVSDVRDKALQIPNVSEADVQLVFDPPWSKEMMSEAAQLQTGMI